MNDVRGIGLNFKSSIIVEQAEEMANELINDSSFNAAKPNVSGWYNNCSKVEVVARTIYAECREYEPDHRAVAWVIVNRMLKDPYDGNTIGDKAYSVVTAPGQFATVTGGNGSRENTVSAKTSSTSYWQQSIYLACVLFVSGSLDDIYSEFSKPAGINNQRGFYGAFKLGERLQNDKDAQLDLIYNVPDDQDFGVDEDGRIRVRINTADGSVWRYARNVASAGWGSKDDTYTCINLNEVRGMFLDRQKQNVFFTATVSMEENA